MERERLEHYFATSYLVRMHLQAMETGRQRDRADALPRPLSPSPPRPKGPCVIPISTNSRHGGERAIPSARGAADIRCTPSARGARS
mmetsp:Transcript_7109/g.5660  ORF Transcript_7109/g.5660 Transcript_7109/m.5660 type:complete len:87 (-) Transcript_7109:57-317(-)